jgi:hypothetical protein
MNLFVIRPDASGNFGQTASTLPMSTEDMELMIKMIDTILEQNAKKNPKK